MSGLHRAPVSPMNLGKRARNVIGIVIGAVLTAQHPRREDDDDVSLTDTSYDDDDVPGDLDDDDDVNEYLSRMIPDHSPLFSGDILDMPRLVDDSDGNDPELVRPYVYTESEFQRWRRTHVSAVDIQTLGRIRDGLLSLPDEHPGWIDSRTPVFATA